MPQVPSFLRRVIVADGADPDWAATQVAPDASICINPVAASSIIVTALPYDVDNVLAASGTIDLQLIDVGVPQVFQGQQLPTIVTGSPVDAGVGVGEALVYDVAGSNLITMRVANIAAIDPTATYVDIFWRGID